jgi:hypothetical protein
MAGWESRGAYRRKRADIINGRESWRELLPDLLWPAMLAVAIAMVIGFAL